MECLEFRRLCDSDPNIGGREFSMHAEQCTACARELERARRFDARLLAALKIDVPVASRDGRSRSAPSPAGRRFIRRMKQVGFGLAAALMVAGGIGMAVRLMDSPATALAAAVVEHIRNEPEALREDRPVLDFAVVRQVLARHGVRLAGQIGAISYVRICPFEGREAAHLVVQTSSGPVAVMLLLDEHASESIVIDNGSYFGRIVPAGSGSIAVVGIGHPVDAAERSRIVAAVVWEA